MLLERLPADSFDADPVALFASVPAAEDVPTMWTEKLDPAASEGTEGAVSMAPSMTPGPPTTVQLTPEGRASASRNPKAVPRPTLLTVIVNPTAAPEVTGVASAVLVTRTSGARTVIAAEAKREPRTLPAVTVAVSVRVPR